MAAPQEESTITYEALSDLEMEFDDVETEIIRQQNQLTLPLYAKRAALVAQIPNFWPLVIEQAPPDLDDYIQPSDSALLLSSLTSVAVTRFEAAAGAAGGGDPRSVAIRFDFAANDVFADASLTKRFWWRRAADGWAGLVSEPVDIRWKKGRDLTHGMLGLVKKVYDAETTAAGSGLPDDGAAAAARALAADRAALRRKIESTGLGGVSFFAWFGYVGRRVGAEESRAAGEAERERRRRRREGRELGEVDAPAREAGEGEDGEEDDALEIFDGGDELALFIADDLWPNAIKYFTQAQERDAMSDDDFESDEEEETPSPNASPVRRPAKKQKGL